MFRKVFEKFIKSSNDIDDCGAFGLPMFWKNAKPEDISAAKATGLTWQCQSYDGNLPVHLAAIHSSDESLERLLEVFHISKSSVKKIRNGNGRNALELSAMSANLATFSYLFDEKFTQAECRVLACYAAKGNNVQIMNSIMGRLTEPVSNLERSKQNLGHLDFLQKAVFSAVENRNEIILAELLNYGFPAVSSNMTIYEDPFFELCYPKTTLEVKMLEKLVVAENAANRVVGGPSTLLERSIELGIEQSITMLINYGANEDFSRDAPAGVIDAQFVLNKRNERISSSNPPKHLKAISPSTLKMLNLL